MAHFLLVTFPAQGHINPTLHFAKRLVHAGARVTFATSVSALRRMIKSSTPDGLSYASFSDGSDEGFKPTDDASHFMAQLKQVGSRTVSDLVGTLAREGRPVTCIVYTLLLPWAADVARDLAIPSVLLWIQPATVMAIYYHYFHGFDYNKEKDPSSTIELPGLPLLTHQDLPSLLLPSSPYACMIPTFVEIFRNLKKDANPRVLVNTFEALEGDAMRAIDSVNLIGIGPLIPQDSSDSGDLFKKSEDCIEWLDSKPKSSVVYVSFGSMSVLQKRQMEEIAKVLAESGRPFLWVITPSENGTETETETEFWKGAGANIEEGDGGMIVQWCSQMEVLSHPSVGCFVTHCGWNSTMESMAMGVPVVCFPQWTDQPTTAKLVEDVWRTGVRVRVNGEAILEGGELKKCIRMVMEDKRGEEIRKNAVKWRDAAREAAGEGGSSDKNIRAFVEEMIGNEPGRDERLDFAVWSGLMVGVGDGH